MKTLEIIGVLKKDGMLVELEENGSIYDDMTSFRLLTKGYEVLGMVNDLTEEICEPLVHKFNILHTFYKNYGIKSSRDSLIDDSFISPLESFHSALETKVYWENPIPEPPFTIGEKGTKIYSVGSKYIIEYKNAQSRTFDKERTAVLVKS